MPTACTRCDAQEINTLKITREAAEKAATDKAKTDAREIESLKKELSSMGTTLIKSEKKEAAAETKCEQLELRLAETKETAAATMQMYLANQANHQASYDHGASQHASNSKWWGHGGGWGHGSTDA